VGSMMSAALAMMTRSMLFLCAALGSAVWMPAISADRFTRTVEYDTDEGTYVCVDVSPDGKTLIFDLLGDIYTMPIAGGKAEPLLSGRPWDRCPRYSPDGKAIVFISDRGNQDNAWVMSLASRKLHSVTNISPFGEGIGAPPVWLPNGRDVAYVAPDDASRQKLWIVPAVGGAPRIAPDSSPQGRLSPPTFAPDGSVAY
jgi:Tol biopolymer transport system component